MMPATRAPANVDHTRMTMRWPPHIYTHINRYAGQHSMSFHSAALKLVMAGLEHQRAAGRYEPPPTIGCTYTNRYPSAIPCHGPVEHVVVYRSPSGREHERNTVCEAHQDEAMQRPAATGANIIAELRPLP